MYIEGTMLVYEAQFVPLTTSNTLKSISKIRALFLEMFTTFDLCGDLPL